MKNNKKGKECIEVNVKCISPFHILVLTSWFDEILIAYKPATQDILMKYEKQYSLEITLNANVFELIETTY
jgi:hypothetical protein